MEMARFGVDQAAVFEGIIAIRLGLTGLSDAKWKVSQRNR
jgi:hypothetical protein